LYKFAESAAISRLVLPTSVTSRPSPSTGDSRCIQSMMASTGVASSVTSARTASTASWFASATSTAPSWTAVSSSAALASHPSTSPVKPAAFNANPTDAPTSPVPTMRMRFMSVRFTSVEVTAISDA
jgi:hypothetical protein